LERVSSQFLEGSAILDTAAIEVGNFLEKVSNEFQDYNTVLYSFNRYVENTKTKVMGVLEFDEYLENLCNLNVREFQSQFSLFLEKNYNYFEVENNPNGEETDIYNSVLHSILQELKHILKALRKLHQ
jgi:hypothetical protein